MEASSLSVIPSDVAEIAGQINRLHREAQQIAKEAVEQEASAVEKAVECGQMLLQVKGQLPHGEFMSWVSDNCEFCHAQACTYMKVAANFERAVNIDNTSIRKALAAITSDPRAENSDGKAKQERDLPKRGRPWSEILAGYAKRKKVSFDELAESVGMKNAEKIKRYASQWEDASGLVIEKGDDGISVKAGTDAIVAIFEQLPAKSKTTALQRLRLDEDVVEKKLAEFKRNNQSPGEHVSGVLYKVNDLLHGMVQQYRNKEWVLRGVTEDQANDLIRIQSSIESLVSSVQEILIGGCGNGISKK